MSNGGIKGFLNTSTDTVASGKWRLEEQKLYRENFNWPIPPLNFPVTENLILLLDANESSSYRGIGTDWFDLSPEENDGVLTNGPIHNSTYFDFDGDNDYVDLGTIITANPLQLSSPTGGGLSISFAVWFDSGGDEYQRIIDKSNGGNAANGHAIFLDHLNNQIGIIENSANQMVSGSNSILRNQWYIATITHNQSTGAWVWYVNGSSSSSGTITYNIPSVQTNARLATWNHSDTRELNGRIGFIAVHEKPITSTEVTNIYNHYKDIYGL